MLRWKRVVEQKEYLQKLCGANEAVADARRLTEEFPRMARELEGGKLDGWLEEADACATPAKRRIADGLRKDLPAVRAGLTESGGPTVPWRGSSTN